MISINPSYRLSDVYEIPSLSLSTVKFWTGEFKRGRLIVSYEERLGRPGEVTAPDAHRRIWASKLSECIKLLKISWV